MFDKETGYQNYVSMEKYLEDISELQKKLEYLTTENDLLKDAMRFTDEYFGKVEGIKKDLATLRND